MQKIFTLIFFLSFFISAHANAFLSFNSDSCLVADTLTVSSSCNPQSFSLTAYGNPNEDMSCNGDADDARWFVFQVNYPNLIVEVQPSADIDVVIEFFNGNSCIALSPLSCTNDNGIGEAESKEFIGLTIGAFRYFRVFDAATGTPLDSNFTVCVYHAPCPEATITPFGPTVFCSGQSVVLQASPGDFYTWSTGANTPSITVSTSGNYSVTVINFTSSCSSTSQPISISVNPLPPNFVSVSGSTTLCEGDSVTISAIQGSSLSYQWKRNNELITGATNRQLTTQLAGTYNAVITNVNTGCSNTSSNVNVIVITPPATDYTHTNPTEICDNGNVQLSVEFQIGVSYQWFRNNVVIPGAVSNIFNANQDGEYYVDLVKSVCTRQSDPITVVFHPLPLANFPSGDSSAVCTGDSIFIIGNPIGGATYQWFRDNELISGENQSFITTSLAGIYRYTVTDLNGCLSTSGDYTLSLLSLPVLELIPAVSSACIGDSVLLRALADRPVSYTWQRDLLPIDVLDQDTIFANVSGQYRFIAIDNLGCTAISNMAQVTIHPLPEVIIEPSEFPICIGNQVSLLSNGEEDWMFTWLFNGDTLIGEGLGMIEISDEGIYQLIATDHNGCTNTSDSLEINFLDLPAAPILSSDDPLSFCEGGVATINIINFEINQQYQWFFNDMPIEGITGAEYQAAFSGSYIVVVNDSNACFNTSLSTQVTVFPLPQVSFTITPDTFCNNQGSITLTGGSPLGGFYSGEGVQGNVFDPSLINAPASANIIYTYTDANSCQGEAEASVFVDNCTAIENLFSSNEILFYPNPVQDILHIRFQNSNAAHIRLCIFDIRGREVFSQNGYLQENLMLNLDNLQPGTYFVHLLSNGFMFRKQFVKL
ncbi:MAG: T9SS type A sorting domain-containing protein [Flavobacteriales bacterium]